MDTITTGPTGPSGPTGRPRLGRRGLAAVAVAVLGLAVGATGVALATDGQSSPSPGATTSPDDKGDRPGQGWRGYGHGPMHGMPGRRLGMGGGGVLHGEFVVPDPDGGYRTMRVQGGEVTAVSDSSVTVKSEDGFTQKYTVTDDTLVNSGRDGIDSIEVGEDVRVQGVETGSGVEALHVVDLSHMQRLRDRYGPPKSNDDDRNDSGTSGQSTSLTGLGAV